MLEALFAPFCSRLEWMSIESAEMTKHALNAFLATSVTFINEVARLCEVVGADAREVERGLKSEARIGPGAYLSPGAAFAGGTLARDVQFLSECGLQHHVATPLMSGVQQSNEVHKYWVMDQVDRALGSQAHPVVAILGLTYKPGTSTLRRSQAVELCRHLLRSGVVIRVHDPVVRDLPEGVDRKVQHCESACEALQGADVAVLATPWPEYRSLTSKVVRTQMRRPQVIDPNYFLSAQLAGEAEINYIATGIRRTAA
jgi:UDPglucose 6-dehydrogenase